MTFCYVHPFRCRFCLPLPQVNDRGLYVPGQMWLSREDILGRARGTLRYVGMVTIILNDYPPLK